MRLMGRCTMALVMVVACVSLLGVGGCGSKGQINAAAVNAPMRGILARHDAYVAADATLAPVERETFLRSSALVTTVLDTALATPKPSPANPGMLAPLPFWDDATSDEFEVNPRSE